jgi:hypothetical protein
MRKILSTAAVLGLMVPGATLFADETNPPIEKIEVAAGDHLVVNGKPFLPIMSWAQSPKRYPLLKELGFNTQAGGNADPDAAQKSNTYAIAPFRKQWAKHPYLLGWLQGDEPDMPRGKGADAKPKVTAEDVTARHHEIRQADTAHPVFQTLTQHFTKDHSSYPPAVREQIYPQYVAACEVIGFDVYPIYGTGYATHLNQVGDGVAELRKLAGPNRPVYAWIETCKGSKWMVYEKQPDVLPVHTRNEVWQAIINGATAIGYFTHAWRPKFAEFAPTPEMRKELKRLNGQLTRLAPAILAPPSPRKITMTLQKDLQCQFMATTLDGATYIFALNRDLGPGAANAKQFDPIHPRGGKATFTVAGLKAGTVIDVLDENRTLVSENQKFTDDFSSLAEHLYRLPK